MQITTNATFNLQAPDYSVVYEPQGNELSRFVAVKLMDGSAPWQVPANTSALIRYRKPDGTFGAYDSNEKGQSAYSISGSTITVELVSQMLTVAGNVAAQIDFYNSGGQHLSTFVFRVAVEESPITDGYIESSDYFNVLTASLAEAQQIWQEIRAAYGAPRTASNAAAMTDHNLIYVFTGTTTSSLTNGHWYYWNGSAWTDGGVYNSTAFTTDTTLTISGAAADAKATGDMGNEIKVGLDALAGISIEKADGFYSKRYTIPTTDKWQTASYVRITDFPVSEGDTIVCGCSELRQLGPGVGEIRVYNSSNTQVASASIPAAARLTSGFKFEYTVEAENADHLTVTVYGVGNATPTVGDYTNIVDAYCMIGEAAIPAGIVSYDNSDVETELTALNTELTALNTELDTLPLKSIVNYEDILVYRERLEYTATSNATWQGGYQINLTIPATEGDIIGVYCADFDIFGNWPIAIRSLDANGQSIYSHSVSRVRLIEEHGGSAAMSEGTVSANITFALISYDWRGHEPAAGDLAYVNHIVFYKNGVALEPFVSVGAIDKMDPSAIYALPTGWSNRIQPIQNAQGGKFTFAVQTDTHFGNIGTGITAESYKDILNNLSKLTEYVGFDFICNLGDIIRGYAADATVDMLKAYTEAMHRYVTNLRCPLFVIPGNHDTNLMYAEAQSDPSLQITKETIYSKLIPFVKNSAPGAVFNGRSLYYYMDFEDSGIRAIFLNSTDGDYSGSAIGNTFVISEAQAAWFASTALATNKRVMVFCHCPLVDGLASQTVSNRALIMDALYTFKSNGGTVIGCFYGHTHNQNSLTDDHDVLHITFTNGGTCAEVAIVDTENRAIQTLGIGSDPAAHAVTDRSFTY